MAKAKSAWEKFAERDAERDREAASTDKTAPKKMGALKTQGDSKLDELIGRADPMIEQLQNLYAQFMAGALKIPPIENRKQLQALMDRIAAEGKPTLALQFRAQGITAKFNTYKERWDKLLQNLEDGKIKRR